jgi:hypothetical protein
MLNQASCSTEGSDQVFGFLCQKTNVFYAFESYETYQQFLLWLKDQSRSAEPDIHISKDPEGPQPPDEAEQMVDFELATREIMGVFNDPIF